MPQATQVAQQGKGERQGMAEVQHCDKHTVLFFLFFYAAA